MTGRGPKLIGLARSRAFRALWMLEEIGIPFQHLNALPHSEEAKKHNPLGKIPILVEEDGFVLYETNAIIGYLGDKYRGAGSASGNNNDIVPLPGTKERGLYEQTMSVLATELDVQGLWIHRKHETMGDVFTHIPDAVEHARKYFNKTNRILIQQLKDSREAALAAEATAKADTGGRGFYLLGSDFTAADIVYVHCLGWSKEIGWDAKWKDDATLKDYIDLCRSRPAYSRLLQSMGEKVRQNKSSNL